MSTSTLELHVAKLLFGPTQRMRTWQQLCGLLRERSSVEQALRHLYDQASRSGLKPNDPRAVVFREWKRIVECGGCFSDAITGWVPHGELAIIRAGEQGANLSESLTYAAAFINANNRVKRAAQDACLFPAFLFAATGYLILLLMGL